MDNVIELLTSKEVIVVYIVIAVACLLCFIIYLVDRNQDKRKRKQNTKELNKLVEDVNEANEALDQQEAENEGAPVVDPNASVAPVMVADGVDVVEDDFASQLPVGAVKEEEKTFMPEPADLQAYNSNFAEELEDNGPIRDAQPVVASSEIAPAVTDAPIAPPVEDNMVLDQMNEVVAEAAPAAQIPVEDITIQDKSLVPERERIEEIVYTNAEPTEEEATRELQKITEELEKAANEAAPMEPIVPEQQMVEEPVQEEAPVAEEVNTAAPVENEIPTEVEATETNMVEQAMKDIPTPEIPVPEEVAVPEVTNNPVADIPVPDIPTPEEVVADVPVTEVPVAEEVVPEVPTTEEVGTDEPTDMQEPNNSIDVARYENDQEENAIISLDELERKSEEMYAANEETQYADEGNEPISLEDLENRRQQIVNSEVNEEVSTEVLEDGNNPAAVENVEVMEDAPTEEVEELAEPEQLSFDDSYEESKHSFKSTPFISPVFGFDRSDSISNKERVAQKEKADKFLSNLKDLQNRLNAN